MDSVQNGSWACSWGTPRIVRTGGPCTPPEMVPTSPFPTVPRDQTVLGPVDRGGVWVGSPFIVTGGLAAGLGLLPGLGPPGGGRRTLRLSCASCVTSLQPSYTEPWRWKGGVLYPPLTVLSPLSFFPASVCTSDQGVSLLLPTFRCRCCCTFLVCVLRVCALLSPFLAWQFLPILSLRLCHKGLCRCSFE